MGLILLTALLGFGTTLLIATVKSALVGTLLLFLFVTLVGLWLSNRAKYTLADQKLGILAPFWLIKLISTLALLHVGWIPELDQANSLAWGYDPQRYFQHSWDLVQSNWDITGLQQYYQGIIIYYAGIFYLFGHNPVIPALINAFVTLLGTLFLIRCAYHFMPSRTPSDWRIAYLLLIPEVLWYDVMTSRETLMAVLIVVSVLASGRYMVGVGRATLMSTIVLVSTASVAILIVRTSMVISLLACISLMVVFLQSRWVLGPFIKIALIVFSVVILMAGSAIQQSVGGYEFDLLARLDRLQSPGGDVAETTGWSDQSIGLLLVPNGLLQSIAFVPPRMVLYLAAPLPIIAISLSDLVAGSWVAWQRLMTIPTSVMMLLVFPYVLAGTGLAWSLRKAHPALMIIPIAFWVNFAAVAGGNFIIHERYRLMFTLLLFACAWIGHTRCSLRAVNRWAVLWFGVLSSGAALYIVYKVI